MGSFKVCRIKVTDRGLEHRPGQLKSLRNFQAARRTRQTVNQPIGRFECDFIEFHRRVRNARCRFCIDLQPVVMGCSNRQGADFSEFVQNGTGKGGAFAGLGAASDFIE